MRYPLSDVEMRRLKKVPQQPLVWEAIRVPASQLINDAPDDVCDSDVVIWGDITGEAIRNMQFVADANVEEVAQSLAAAILGVNNSISPARPQKVLMRDRRLMLTCKTMLRNLSIDFEYVAGASVFDQVIKELGVELARMEPAGDQDLGPIESYANRLWKAAPWKILRETEVIRIEFLQRPGDEFYAVTVGGGIGLHLGVLLFRDKEQVKKLFQHGAAQVGEDLMIQNFEDCYSVTFDVDEPGDQKRPGATQDPLADEMPRLNIAVVDGEVDLRPLRDKLEIHYVKAALEGYLTFYERHRDAFDSHEFPALSEPVSIDCKELAERGLDELVVSSDPQVRDEALVQLMEYQMIESGEMIEPQTVDLRAGSFKASFESVERRLFDSIEAGKAYYVPPMLDCVGRNVISLRIHVPKRRAKNMVDALSDLDLGEFLSISLEKLAVNDGPSLIAHDDTDRIILGDLADCGIKEDELVKKLAIPKTGHRFFSLVITAGNERPEEVPIQPSNIVGAFFCVVDHGSFIETELIDE